MQGLQHLIFSQEHTQRLAQRYTRVLRDSQLWHAEHLRQVESDFRGTPGIYFWVLVHQGKLHRIYIGKAKSLGYRVHNYASHFQPHSTNDFKLQIFHGFIKEALVGSELELYFQPRAIAELKDAERDEISFFAPLLNSRMQVSPEARAALQDAFVHYYQSGFVAALSGS